MKTEAAAATAATKTTLSGVARDAKMGAILSRTDGAVYYLSGMHEWPDGINGKLISVTGIIGKEVVVPEATQGADGSWTQGGSSAGGEDDTIREAAWNLIPLKFKKEDKHGEGSRHTMQTSDKPIKAPANYKSLAYTSPTASSLD